jgi:hypothetical protein
MRMTTAMNATALATSASTPTTKDVTPATGVVTQQREGTPTMKRNNNHDANDLQNLPHVHVRIHAGTQPVGHTESSATNRRYDQHHDVARRYRPVKPRWITSIGFYLMALDLGIIWFTGDTPSHSTVVVGLALIPAWAALIGVGNG